MRITITQDFDSADAAFAFLTKVTGQPVEPVVTAAAGEEAQASSSPAAPVASEKPARKPRADRGQKREPYGPRASSAVAGEGANGAASSASTAEPASPAAPEPQTSSEPAPTVQPGSTPGSESAAEEDFPATLDGVRKAGKALSNTKGKGMEACLLALKSHGVVRVTDLKPEQFEPIIKYMLGQSSAEGIAAAKKWWEDQRKGKAK